MHSNLIPTIFIMTRNVRWNTLPSEWIFSRCCVCTCISMTSSEWLGLLNLLQSMLGWIIYVAHEAGIGSGVQTLCIKQEGPGLIFNKDSQVSSLYVIISAALQAGFCMNMQAIKNKVTLIKQFRIQMSRRLHLQFVSTVHQLASSTCMEIPRVLVWLLVYSDQLVHSEYMQ